jgi:hypothetical protein
MQKYNLETLPSEWISAPLNNFYLFGDKVVSINISTNQIVDKEGKSIEKLKNEFLQNCLFFFDKKVDSEDVSELLDSISLVDDYIDPFPNIGQKFMFGLEKKSLDDLEDAMTPMATSDNESVYSTEEFYKKASLISSSFKKYQKEYLEANYKNNGVIFKGLDFLAESENIVLFTDTLKALLETNDIDIENYEAFLFRFSPDYGLLSIGLEGDLGKKNLNIGFSYFSNNSVFQVKQTNYFILLLNELYEKCLDVSNTYYDIVEQFFIQKQKQTISKSSPIHRTDPNSDTYGVTNEDVTKKLANSSEISKRFAKEFQNIATRSFYETPCLSPEDKERADRERRDSARKENNFRKELTESIGDAFVDNLPSILQGIGEKGGKEAAQSLGRDFLNRLGVCGLGDIVSMVANTATSFLDPQEYTDELTKCALDKMKNENMQALARNLEKFNRGTQILERYRTIVGDSSILPPWKTNGYTPPTSYQPQARIDRYTVPVKSGEAEFDINFLFSAYRDSIRAELSSENILQAMTESFPDEMGWISFFVDSSSILLKKCIPQSSLLQINKNFCEEKKPGLPPLESNDVNACCPTSPSIISRQIVEEMKNLVIRLVVRTITSSMQQLFQIIAAGVSFDANYFKRGDYIPDLFQNPDYMYNAICEKSSNNKRDRESVNRSVRKTLYDSQSRSMNSDNEVSTEQINQFLRDVSVSIGEYEKIKLLRGQANYQTYEKVILLAKNNGLESLLSNSSEVERFFLELSKNLNVADLEKNYFDSIYDYQPWSSFCILDSDMLDRAYYNNKDGITQDQIDNMKEKLKDIQKDKICMSADMLGNPNGPLLGEIGKILSDKNGPIYKKVGEQEEKFYSQAVKSVEEAIVSSYSSDLYSTGGVYDVSMASGSFSTGSFNPKDSDTIGYNNLFLQKPPDDLWYVSNRKVNLSNAGTYERTPSSTKFIASELQGVPESDVDKIIQNFDSSAMDILVKRYDVSIKGSISEPTLGYWKRIYQNTLSKEKLNKFVGMGRDSEIYSAVQDFQLPAGKEVPFNLLFNKTTLVQKYIYLTSYIRTFYLEKIMKAINIFDSFTVDTNAAVKLVQDEIIDIFNSEQRDNAVQILYKISPEYLSERISDESFSTISGSMAKNINNAVNKWFNGEYTNIGQAYSENRKEVDAAVRILVELSLSGYTQENLRAALDRENQLENFPLTSRGLIPFGSYVVGAGFIKIGDLNVEEISKDINNANFVWTGQPYIRMEEYVNVGTPIDNTYPSDLQPLSYLLEIITDRSLTGQITNIWPDGWKFGVRACAVYKPSGLSVDYENNSIKEYSKKNKALKIKNSDGDECLLIPLISYEKDNELTTLNTENLRIGKEALYDNYTLAYELSLTEKFEKFYQYMNIENIINFYTNYYIERADALIGSLNAEDFFAKTKLLLEDL